VEKGKSDSSIWVKPENPEISKISRHWNALSFLSLNFYILIRHNIFNKMDKILKKIEKDVESLKNWVLFNVFFTIGFAGVIFHDTFFLFLGCLGMLISSIRVMMRALKK